MCPELNNTLYETVFITYKPSDVTRTRMCVCYVLVHVCVHVCGMHACVCMCMAYVHVCACVWHACIVCMCVACVHVCACAGTEANTSCCEASALPWALARALSPYQVGLSCRLSSLHEGLCAIPSQAFLCVVARSFSQHGGICGHLSR